MVKYFKYLLFIFLSFTIISLSADNNKVDSLENIISSTQGIKRIEAIIELSNFYQSTNFTKSLSYANNALLLSKINNYKLGIAIAHNNIGYSLTDMGRYNEAIDNYAKSIDLFKSLNEKNREAIAYNDIAYIYQVQGLVKKAIKNYIISLKKLEELDDKNSVAACLNNIGLLYHDQGNLDKALDYYNRSLKIKEQLGNEKSIAVSLNNIGSIYFSQKQYFEAKEYFFTSLIKRKKVNDKSGIAQSLINIAALYREQKNYPTSLEYLKQAEKIQEELKNKAELANTFNSMGVIYRYLKDYKNSKKYLIKAYNIAHEINSPLLIKNSAIALSILYRDLNQFDKAYPLIIEHFNMADTLENTENTRKLTQIGLQYEFEKKINENELAQIKKNHEHEIDMKEQKFISYSFAIGLVGLIILTIVIFISLKEKKKANLRITQQKIEIEEKSLKLGEALTNITDSVIYAKRIQEALLKAENHISKHIPPHFIYFQPKDIVSGDFYWSYEKEGMVYIAAVDCTGHGVPGALMSMLGISFLNSISAANKVLSPSEILNKLRNKIIAELGQKGNDWGSRDGMDISLTKIDVITKEIEWAGANNPLWIIRNKELQEIKADRQAINYNDNPTPFTSHSFQLKKGDQIYMFTDGYADQFGGEKGKKFKIKSFKKLLLSISEHSIKEQKKLLKKHFIQWKKNQEQTDDVCVIGLRI